MSPWRITTDALHCGMPLVMDGMKSSSGSLQVAEIWETSTERKGKHRDGREYTALEIARERNYTEAVSLLERFVANPAQTRYEVRVKLGMLDELAAEVFALTVFLCDDLLQLKPAADTGALRFFTIAVKLPMELQMILCHRVVGSTKQNILRKDSEDAFKSLARVLLL